jgi:hypothetical protein
MITDSLGSKKFTFGSTGECGTTILHKIYDVLSKNFDLDEIAKVGEIISGKQVDIESICPQIWFRPLNLLL